MTTPNRGLVNQVENTLQPGVAFNLLADVLDKRFGAAVIDFEADAPLELTQGQTDYSTLVFTDTGVVLTGPQDVEFPAAFPSMLVINETAETLTMLKAGETGVSVAAGASLRVSCGPTDVVRETAIGIPEAPIDGQQYARKDGDWELVAGGGGGGGGITLINSATAGSGGAATLTVGSIPGTYKSLLILLNGRGETAAGYIDLFLRFNGDTGANYDFQLNIATDTSPGYGSQHALTAMPAGYVPAASAPTGRSGSVRLEIPNYAGTLFDKQAIGISGMTFATSNGTSSQVLSGAWRPGTPAAITSISIYASAGDMAEGSELLVFGIG